MQIISTLQARTLLSHGCEGFLATIHDTTSDVPSIHDQPIVSEFPDVENGIIDLYFVRTEYQLADMFTKALPEDKFKYLVRRICMRCLTPTELEVLAKESA
nr:ribonuclease H [Tanacetum cinerariifolium]